MKHFYSVRTIFFCFFSAIILFSCSKSDYLEPMPACETTFTGEITSCGVHRALVYKFTSATEEKDILIEGDLIDFVGDGATITVGGADLSVTQTTVAANSVNHIKIEGAVLECTEITITITWTSSNHDDNVSSDWTVKNMEGTELAKVLSMACEPR